MSTIGELTKAIKRFVYNNTNAQDLFQGQQAGVSLETLLNKACLTAMNNARLYAERNSSFTWLDTTVSALLPVGLGVNLDRMYWDERAIDVGDGVLTILGQFQFRFDQRGQLIIAIKDDYTAFWGGRDKDTLQAFVAQLGPDDDPIDGVRTGTFEVQEAMGVVVIDAEDYQAYKVGFRDATITTATAWDSFYSVGTGHFVQSVRMNTLYAASMVYQGGLTPINLDTRQGQHMRKTIQTNRNTLDWREKVPSTTVCETDPVLMFDGRKLRPNFVLSEDVTLSLTGSRWMDLYTVADITTIEDSTQTDTLIIFGFDFMMWQAIIELNNIVQIFVPRAEGSLPPPYKARDEAWGSMLINDAFAQTSYYHQS